MLGYDKLDTTAKYVNDEQKFGEGAVTKVVDISQAGAWHQKATEASRPSGKVDVTQGIIASIISKSFA